MSDLYEGLYQATWYLAPVFAFLIGAAGSIHCVGMCGGLSLVCSNKKFDSAFYNFGRLCGYLSLVLVFSLLGNVFLDGETKHYFTLLGGAVCAVFMIYIGAIGIKGKEPRINLPFMEKAYKKAFAHFSKSSYGRPFGLGASSMLLPCALSNGFILAAISFGGGGAALALVVFFWAGTLPAMLAGPKLAYKFSDHLGVNGRKLAGALFLIAGLASLSAKVAQAWDLGVIC